MGARETIVNTAPFQPGMEAPLPGGDPHAIPGAAPGGTPNFAPGGAPGFSPGAQPQAPGGTMGQPPRMNFLNMLAISGGGALTGTLAKYLEELTKAFDRSRDMLDVKMVRLSDPVGAHAFYVPGNAATMVLYFPEASGYVATDGRPASDMIHLINAPRGRSTGSLTLALPGAILLNAIGVYSHDYDRAALMAWHITQTLLATIRMDAGSATISELVDGAEVVLEANPMACQQLFQNHYPLSVMPRADLGLVIQLRHRRQQQLPGFQSMMPEVESPRSLAAVAGMVEMIYSPGQDKFTPVVRITSILSQIPIPAVTFLAIAAAVEAWLRQERWKAPFASPMMGKPNLGNLRRDVDNPQRLYRTNSPQELDVFVRNNCTDPVLILDVAEGQPRPPAIYQFMDNQTAVMADVQRVFPMTANPVMAPAMMSLLSGATAVSSFLNQDIIGYVGLPGQLVDSRYITYLDLVAQAGGQMALEAQQPLLGYNSRDPKPRADVVAANATNFVRTSNVYMMALHTSFLALLSQLLRQNNVNMVTSSGSDLASAPLESFLLANQLAYQQIVPIITPGGWGHAGYGAVYGGLPR